MNYNDEGFADISNPDSYSDRMSRPIEPDPRDMDNGSTWWDKYIKRDDNEWLYVSSYRKGT